LYRYREDLFKSILPSIGGDCKGVRTLAITVLSLTTGDYRKVCGTLRRASRGSVMDIAHLRLVALIPHPTIVEAFCAAIMARPLPRRRAVATWPGTVTETVTPPRRVDDGWSR
jgi:hypothetical protein